MDEKIKIILEMHDKVSKAVEKIESKVDALADSFEIDSQGLEKGLAATQKAATFQQKHHRMMEEAERKLFKNKHARMMKEAEDRAKYAEESFRKVNDEVSGAGKALFAFGEGTRVAQRQLEGFNRADRFMKNLTKSARGVFGDSTLFSPMVSAMEGIEKHVSRIRGGLGRILEFFAGIGNATRGIRDTWDAVGWAGRRLDEFSKSPSFNKVRDSFLHLIPESAKERVSSFFGRAIDKMKTMDNYQHQNASRFKKWVGIMSAGYDAETARLQQVTRGIRKKGDEEDRIRKRRMDSALGGVSLGTGFGSLQGMWERMVNQKDLVGEISDQITNKYRQASEWTTRLWANRTKSYESARKEVKKFYDTSRARAVPAIDRAKEFGKSLHEQIGSRLPKIQTRISNLWSRLSRNFKESRKNIDLKDSLGVVKKQLQEMDSTLERVRKSSRLAWGRLRGGGEAFSDIIQFGKNTAGFARGVNNAVGSVKSFGSAIASIPFKGAIASLAGLYTTWKLFNAAVSRGEAFYIEIENAELQLEHLMGSAGEAKLKVDELITFAKDTPFDLPGVLQAQRLLFKFGGQALATTENLRMIGDASAVAGQSINRVSRWIGRMWTLLEAGKPFGEAALYLQEMGVFSAKFTMELDEMRQAGEPVERIFAKIWENMAQFSGATSDLSKSTAGQIERQSEAWSEFWAVSYGSWPKRFMEWWRAASTATADWLTKEQERATNWREWFVDNMKLAKSSLSDLMNAPGEGSDNIADFGLESFNEAAAQLDRWHSNAVNNTQALKSALASSARIISDITTSGPGSDAAMVEFDRAEKRRRDAESRRASRQREAERAEKEAAEKREKAEDEYWAKQARGWRGYRREALKSANAASRAFGSVGRASLEMIEKNKHEMARQMVDFYDMMADQVRTRHGEDFNILLPNVESQSEYLEEQFDKFDQASDKAAAAAAETRAKSEKELDLLMDVIQAVGTEAGGMAEKFAAATVIMIQAWSSMIAAIKAAEWKSVVLGAISAVISVLSLFRDKTDKAAEAAERKREANERLSDSYGKVRTGALSAADAMERQNYEFGSDKWDFLQGVIDDFLAVGKTTEDATHYVEGYWIATQQGNERAAREIQNYINKIGEAANAKRKLADITSRLAEIDARLKDIALRREERDLRAEYEPRLAAIGRHIAGIGKQQAAWNKAFSKRMKAVQEERKEWQEFFDARMERITDDRDATLEAYDAELEAIRHRQGLLQEEHENRRRQIQDEADARLSAIDAEIRKLEKLKFTEDEAWKAARSFGITDRQDMGAQFHAKAASDQVKKWADQIQKLQVSGTGDSQLARNEIVQSRMARIVQDIERHGLTLPEHLGELARILGHHGLELGTGLSEVENSLEELKRTREEIEAELHLKLEALNLERERAESELQAQIDATTLSRKAAEERFEYAIDALSLRREAIEDEFGVKIAVMNDERAAAEEAFAARIDSANSHRAHVEAEFNEKLKAIQERRLEIEEAREAREVEALEIERQKLEAQKQILQGILRLVDQLADVKVPKRLPTNPGNPDPHLNPDPEPGGYPGPRGNRLGSGGIRDYGSGAWMLGHGREAVVTERSWLEAIQRAAAGGASQSNSKLQVVKLELNGLNIGRITLRNQPRAAHLEGVR